MKALLLLALATAMVAGCARQSALPPGTFAGTTAAGAELVIEVGTTKVKVNKVEAKRRADGSLLVEKLPDHPRLECEPQAKGEELRCEVKRGSEREVVELVRL